MDKRTHVPRVACLVLLFMLVLAGCGAPPPATTSAPPATGSGTQVTATPAPSLTDLHTPDDLKARFNQDAGVPRIILLVSPT